MLEHCEGGLGLVAWKTEADTEVWKPWTCKVRATELLVGREERARSVEDTELSYVGKTGE